MRILLTNAERLCADPTLLAQKAERFGVPGCSVALIRGGAVSYTHLTLPTKAEV